MVGGAFEEEIAECSNRWTVAVSDTYNLVLTTKKDAHYRWFQFSRLHGSAHTEVDERDAIVQILTAFFYYLWGIRNLMLDLGIVEMAAFCHLFDFTMGKVCFSLLDFSIDFMLHGLV